MNRTFLELYNGELLHIREGAAEFALEYPKIAARLSLGQDATEECPDPFVERLLEGFAFLSARVRLKLEAEFPRFTQGILETVYPDYLAPLPSACIVRFEPSWQDKSLMGGFKVPRRTRLQAPRQHDDETACLFTTAQEVTIFPIEVMEARYHVQDLADLKIAARYPRARAALRLKLTLRGDPNAQLSALACDRMTFHLHGDGELPCSVLEEILAKGAGLVIQEVGDVNHRRSEFLPMTSLRHAGFEENEALLPRSPQTFIGHRLLREYFVLPRRFLFLEARGLRAALSRFSGREFNLIVPLTEKHATLGEFISASLFKLNCTPAVNLFEKHTDSTDIHPGHSEYQLMVNKQRMLDFEVYQVLEVTGHGQTGNIKQPFLPFYLREQRGANPAAYYTIARRPRQLSEREKKFGAVSTYPGSEVFLSLCDPNSAPFSPDLENLRATCLCTNRHLPLALAKILGEGTGRADFVVDLPGPVSSVHALTKPTPPRPSTVDGRYAWRAVDHLCLNYLSLINKGNDGAAALRELLRLYAINPETDRQIEGVVSVTSQPEVARAPGAGPICFIRGIGASITFDEQRFTGLGSFLLASVIEQFLGSYVSLNSFTRTTFQTEQRGIVLKWPTRTGSIPTL